MKTHLLLIVLFSMSICSCNKEGELIFEKSKYYKTEVLSPAYFGEEEELRLERVLFFSDSVKSTGEDVYLKNNSYDKIIEFVILNKVTCNSITNENTLTFILKPGEKKFLGFTKSVCNDFDISQNKFELVGEIERK